MGTSVKTTVRTIIFARSDRSRQTKPSLLLGDPAVTEAGIVPYLRKIGIDVPERPTDPLEEAPHIRPIPFVADAGDEILAVHEVVNLPIADILAGARREELDDAELGQAQIDHDALPEGAMAVAAQ